MSTAALSLGFDATSAPPILAATVISLMSLVKSFPLFLSCLPFLSDEVYDLDFDYQRKLAYIATSKGVSILRIPFGDSYSDYNDLKIFPSPFLIPEHEKMIVDGDRKSVV